MAYSGRSSRSPARLCTGNGAPAGGSGAARSNRVRSVTGWRPRAPDCASCAASLRPRKPAPPRMVIFIAASVSGRRPDYDTVASWGNAVHRPAMLGPHPFTLFANPRAGAPGMTVLPEAGFRRARAEITAWPGYAPTPLRDLPEIAREAGLGAVRLKDEAGRFGLGSFKALGGGYAVAEVVAGELARRGVAPAATSAELLAGRWRAATETITVTCATDGNHGRAVAWGARRCHCRAVIFIHEGVSAGRTAAIAAYGAEIRRVPGT